VHEALAQSAATVTSVLSPGKPIRATLFNVLIELMLQIQPFGTTCAARAAGRMAPSKVHNLAEEWGGGVSSRNDVASYPTRLLFSNEYMTGAKQNRNGH